MPEANLTTRELSKSFGVIQAGRGVTFSIQPGEIFSLLGLNGAGKTTTIMMLSCLLEPTSGEAMIGGHSIRTDGMAVRRLIGVVPQELALYELMTARQNLLFWGRQGAQSAQRGSAGAGLAGGCIVGRISGGDLAGDGLLCAGIGGFRRCWGHSSAAASKLPT